VPLFEGHQLPSSGSREDIRWKSARGKSWFLQLFDYRLWKSVLTLTVRGNITSSGVVRRQRVPMFEVHRLPSTGSQYMGLAVGEG
jgi:hypothetical protein